MMKKIFFSLLAVAAIASCAKTEELFVKEDSEIKLAPVTALQSKANFTGAVDGITYPVAENFDVYAYWKNVDAGETFTDGTEFLKGENGGVEFVNKGNYWGGAQSYYWPKNGSLRFSAYSPSSVDMEHQQVNDVYSVTGYVQPHATAETWDLLVAPTSPSYSAMTATEKVAIEFQHALSWITLQVKAKDAEAAKVFDVKKVTINDVNTKADFAASMTDGIQYEEWSNHAEPQPYVVFTGSQMASETAADIETTKAGTLVIPQATTSVTVEFTQYGLNGTPDVEGMKLTLPLVLDTDNEPWRPGKHYVYTLVFGLDEILINPSVADWDDVNVGELATDAVNVSTAAQLEAALADPAVTKIVFQADIEGNFTVQEVDGKTLIIDGNGYKLTGGFVINGKTKYKNATTFFQNINFEASDMSVLSRDAFIWSGTYNNDTSMRYPDNVTIKNCTFTATGAAEKLVAGAKFWSLETNLVVEDCSAKNLHSLLQLTSCGKAVVDVIGANVEGCKNGISLNDAKNTTIKNSTISTEGYGVRANGCVANTSIVNSTVTANQPVIVRKMTKAGYVLNVDDATVLTTTSADPYVVIFTQDDDEKAYVAPTVEFTCNVPASMVTKVFPTPEGYARTADDFAAQMKADKENISVILVEDLDVPITSLGTITAGSGEYKLGGESTKNITIDLNGKKLNIETTYWSALGAKNENALFTIKNGTMTSTGNSAGTWNAWDLRFSNCNYAFEDVDFEKAVALDNAGKSTSMKNVNITDSHNTDTYGLWITAEGQTVTLEDCVIDMTPASDGRGIKIDNQYVADQRKVTLNVKNVTFKTEEKSAILVKSVAGAEINASNLDITAVTADTECAVWVDEDAKAYADKVVVSGALKKIEGTTVHAVADQSALKDAAIKDYDTVVLAAGDYVVPASAKGKNVTFVGTGNPVDVKVAVTKVGVGGENCDYGLDGSNATFEGITITTNSSTYIGYARCNGTYKNCVINGTYTLYGNSVFENCTFNVSGDVYNIWTWGAPTATFKNCTFNSDGKALLLYGRANTKLTVEGCTFNDNGGLADLKAAIEIGNDYGTSYELVVNDTEVNGYEINDKGISTGTTLWANKNSMPKDKLNVVVDGVDVY